MIVSGNRSCNGLSEKLNSTDYLPPGTRYDHDGSMHLFFTSEAIVGTKPKRSVEEDRKNPFMEEVKENPSVEELMKKRTVQSGGCR